MNTAVVLVCAGIVFCIWASNFFSSAEMGFSSANTVRLENEAENGSRAARIALYITEHFDSALSTILIGNNLVNIAASSLTSVCVLLLTGSDTYTWVGTIIITILIIIFGETIAKITAKKKPNTLSIRFAYPIRALMILLLPLVWLVVKLTALVTFPFQSEETPEEDESVEQLQSIIETAEDEGVINQERTELVQAAIDFEEISASEVMTSRVDMHALDIEDSMDEIIAFVEALPHSRIPVYEESIDHIIGVLHVNHLLKSLTSEGKTDIRSLLMPPCYVYKTMKLPDVLSEMKKTKQHLAIVTDEYGGTLGIITMEDVLEEIVGDIWDESDEVEQEIVTKGAHDFVLDGDMSIGDFLELTGIEEPEDGFESETVGGWCIEQLGHYPEAGEEFDYENVHVRITSMDDRRVEKLSVHL